MRKFKFFIGYCKPSLVVDQLSQELINDIEVYHNMNIEEELTNLLSEEISRTIDGEVVNLIRNINGRYNI